MKKSTLSIIIIFLSGNVYAQSLTLQDIQQRQSDIVQRNQNISSDNAQCANNSADALIQQALIVSDNASIVNDNQIIATYNANTAQTASGVNWDYFVTLEPQIPFSTWSKVATSINFTAIIPTLGINCAGITEANVNWTNWGTCEANGMTPGLPFGGKNTGIAAFWCGNGKIAGTC